MPLSSQFTLSLELTKLIPLSLDVAGKTYNAAMNLARDLRSSGSDIVIEEDLAELFGRSRITSQMASTFRTIVTKANPPLKLCEGIALCDGPGPTVIRGLTQEAYFSMILQCSFLVSVFEKSSLATAIAYYFEKQVEGTPDGSKIRAAPSLEGIHGTLQACEDQTSAFDWRKYVVAVGTRLGLIESNMFEKIPSCVFRGLVNMLPLVQHFPEDRIIDLRTKHGICSIIVWAHSILGLSVSVKVSSSAGGNTYRFGPSPATVFIDTYERAHHGPSVTMLSASDNRRLFTISSEPDDENIDATFKGPALGYGSRIFDQSVAFEERREKLINEMALITTAFAICISRHLSVTIPPNNGKRYATDGATFSDADVASETTRDAPIEDKAPYHLEYVVSEWGIYRAADLLFHGQKLNKKVINDYVKKYADSSLYSIEEPPQTISVIIEGWSRKDRMWSDLCFTATQLSVLMLAFTHVANLEDCRDFPICQRPHLLRKSELLQNVARWDGSSPLWICHDVWFATMALLILGQTGRSHLQATSLISERGWSMFMSTFGGSDPSSTDAGFITIKKGVPCRHGVWKHRIIDGPNEPVDHPAWKLVTAYPGGVRMPRPIISYGLPFVGEREDSFVVSLRFEVLSMITGMNATRRTGYNELSSALWRTQKARSCKHHITEEYINLEPGCTAIDGCEDRASISEFGRTVIFLTANSPEAQWRTLLALAHDASNEDYGFTPVMLRGSDCCFTCVVDQTMARNGAGPWCIIL